ncbi:Uncharacterized protein OS=Sorangium cellulosum (strain So ce56) GN=sce5710 PE=4 SV=1 [Gemmata massiliana]|uniref:SMI1/KNR4 family protein n=1 Tax=Gemmata massiliana TaxID=1210884 RepID=A0A6P2D1K4_9BACT|nr:hypothetical protein [Gemmata massiliana]VTR93302.1 Uncharacterized protein OS=Sorangium cellulosum (strain So ce56) GN=sce5710 PE=4 SV=1 [Gemmata massiliana]
MIPTRYKAKISEFLSHLLGTGDAPRGLTGVPYLGERPWAFLEAVPKGPRTEAQREACQDPHALIDMLLKRPVTERKLRLLAIARGRFVWDRGLFGDARLEQAVLLGERFVEGLASADEMRAARDLFDRAWLELVRAGTHRPASAARCCVSTNRDEIANCGTLHAQLPFIRDIFGDLLDSVAFAPEWRTSTAVALASQMYESREFGAMPILGDALQDAGCDSADVLNHCRGEGPHVRGCWVVDRVLGKE